MRGVGVLTCPAEGDRPEIHAGSTQTVACGRGYTGEQTRACSLAGEWGAADRSQCGGRRGGAA